MAPTTRITAKSTEGPETGSAPGVEAMEFQTRATQAETARIQAEAERLQAETGRMAAEADYAQAQARLQLAHLRCHQRTPIHSDIDDIRTGKFEPWNLIRLHPVRGQRPSEDEGTSNVDISSGQFTVKKKNHSPSEYASDPLIFLNSFANYIFVYHRLFGREHPDVVIARRWLRIVDTVFEKLGNFEAELAVERQLWWYCY
ncbi:hypothetical protein E4U31_007656 [Claviceps sp. LM219 group G6]|nr:hypothetical protein E4U31_007656 [Claviceps sp. LM219 group G6]